MMTMIPIKATAYMNPTIHGLSPNLLPQPIKFQTHIFPTRIVKTSCNLPRTLKISCSKEKENLSDEMLAVELGLEMKKVKSHNVEREEALKKSRELLFTEMCGFTGLKSDDFKRNWRRMSEDERWVLTKGFVQEWSAQFHPLSARSVKDLVEEYLDEFSTSLSHNLFPDLRKFLGFPANTQE